MIVFIDAGTDNTNHLAADWQAPVEDIRRWGIIDDPQTGEIGFSVFVGNATVFIRTDQREVIETLRDACMAALGEPTTTSNT